MQKIKPFWVVFLILFPFYNTQGRMASDFYFFDKQVQRKYYSHQFVTQILPNTSLPFYHQKITPYFFSYQGSSSFIGLKVYLTKEEIFDPEKTTPQLEDMIVASYQRNNYQKGAFEIFTRSKIPFWTKTLSLWIFDYVSGHDAFIYIKTKKGLKRYPLGRIEHKGWKNFLVPLDPTLKDEDPILEKIKFFNRKVKGGANDLNPLIKISYIESFSVSLKSRDLYPFFTSLNEKVFLWQEEKQAKKGQGSSLFMRLQKGRVWSKKSTLSLFLTLKSPVYLEVYGNQEKIRTRFFALQTPYLMHPGNYRVDIKLPEELDSQKDIHLSDVFFWGLGIFPITEENPEVKVNHVMFWHK